MILDIVGAGLAGLLAGNMLQHRNPAIYERQPNLPNNHSAVLRFRTSAVGDVLNIPFKKVTMLKTVLPWKNAVADAMAYSRKNTGMSRSDRSIISGTVLADRWIAPPNLIERMCNGMFNKDYPINLGIEYEFNKVNEWHPVISTIPMPALMSILKYPKIDQLKFVSTPGVNIKARALDCDAYVSVLVPNPHFPFSRVSISGNEVTIEFPNAKNMTDKSYWIPAIQHHLDIVIDEKSIELHEQHYAKINPIDDDARKDFIYWATDQHGIFSLGRFATWRPGLLLDDLVNDIRLIDKWIDKKDRYAIARADDVLE